MSTHNQPFVEKLKASLAGACDEGIRVLEQDGLDAAALEALMGRSAGLEVGQAEPTETPKASSSKEALQSAMLDSIEEAVTSLLNTFLSTVRRKRNTLSLLNARLNEELLSRIFLLAAEGSDLRTKFQLTHVCGRWRELMIGDARLWRHIDFTQRRALVDESLRRAGQAPIDLRYNWNHGSEGPFVDAFVNIFEEHAPHVRSLSVSLPGNTADAVLRLVSKALPVATAVSVNGDHVVRDGWLANPADDWGHPEAAWGVPVPPPIPDPVAEELFQSNAPRLRYLMLAKLGLPWSLKLFTNLSVLRLTKCYFTNPTDAMDFIEILRELPVLRQLSLSHCKDLCHHSAAEERVVDLPLLEVASFDSLPLADAIQLLSSIKASAQLRLTTKVRVPLDDSATPFRQMNLSNLASLQTIQDLEVNVSYSESFNAENVTLLGSQVKSGGNKNLSFSMGGLLRLWTTHGLPGVCDPFGFSKLKRLSFSWQALGWSAAEDGEPAQRHDAKEDLLYFLTHCPDIEYLDLNGWYGEASDVLSVLSQDENDVIRTPAPCPKLRMLRVDSSMVRDADLKNLILRRRGCKPILSLNMHNVGGVSPETIAWLRERVEDVFWDGEKNDIGSFDDML